MSNQVKPEDRELIEAIAEPWICVEERLCEEAVAVHWEEMLTSLTASLATVRREVFKEARRLVQTMSLIEARSCSIEFINGAQWALDKAAKQIEASATEKGEMNGSKES